MRITINGERLELSTLRQVNPEKWSSNLGKATGNSEDSKQLNYFLDTLRNRVFIYQQQIIAEGNEVSISTIRDKWIVKKEKSLMLLEIFKEHNLQMKELVGKEYAQLTYIRFETTYRHTHSFIKWKFEIEDIDIKKLDFHFISEYSFWLKSVRNCNQNSTIKYLSNFKKIVNFCLKNGWIIRNPFVGFFCCYEYRNMTAELKELGWIINHKKVYRLIKEAKLLYGARIRVAPFKSNFIKFRSLRNDRPLQYLSMDIKYINIHGIGRNALLLTVMDIYSRKVLIHMLHKNIKKGDVLLMLSLMLLEYKVEGMSLRNDNGSQFIAQVVREYLIEKGVY